jgi:2-polyprenyl-6-methoxyphenol hydroxylase-like FAD-dependent oxidoreductase
MTFPKDLRIGVVGGGPAGGFCAFLLRQAGFPVVLFEAAPKVERKVCGEYLSPAASKLFEQAGLPNFLSERFPPLDGIIFFTPDGREVKTHFPRMEGRPSQGYALDRVAMEEALLNLSREAGAEVRMGCRVRSVKRREEGWELLLETGERVEADLLIGADGRRSLVAKSLQLDRNRTSRRVALHCFLPGALPEPRYGQMYFFEDGAYLGLNASPAGTVNFSLVCDVSQIKKIGSPEKVVAHYLSQAPSLQEVVSWQESIPVHTTYPVHHSVKRSFDRRAALIGDAAGLIDPLTGEGIYIALWSAFHLTEQLKRMGDEESVESCLQKYAELKERNFRGKNRLSRFFQWVLKRPALVNRIATYLQKKPARADAFIGMMGHLYSPFEGMKKILLDDA